MQVPPALAQSMFARDIVPDLHRDGGFSVLEDVDGRLGLVEGPSDPNEVFDLGEAADPDLVGHGEEDEEPAVRAAARAPTQSLFLRGGPEAERREVPVYGFLRRFASRGLSVTFAPAPEGALVTIEGSAGRAVRDGIARLGTPGHWPAMADAPHD